jgi:CRP-like cAMP-binding protein
VSFTDAIVLFPAAASVIEFADFRAVAAQSPALRGLVTRHGEALLAQAQQTAACNAVHSVEARLSRWLLRARDLHDGRTLPLTQELLAQMIGVRRNAISIVAHALQEAGTISYSRGQIEIIDVEALRVTSCECHAAIRARQRQLLG